MKNFSDLVAIMRRLRAPGGCPWDREQTHESLLRYLKEESAEVEEAVRKKDWYNLEEELGDVLLQVLFHSEMARQAGYFDINGVLRTLKRKLVLRHPHVFGTKKERETLTPEDVKRRWSDLKAKEKAQRQKMVARRKRVSS
jgi:tetrapyrrole methylase family protein/MazG family protein